MIDPATHRAFVVGALPEPLDGAAAATLDGVIYLAGGETVPEGRPSPSRRRWAASGRGCPASGGRLSPAS